MIDMRIKSLFFDREKVIRAVEKAKRAVLSRAGAFIRTVARTSIRKRKGSAPPGSPPHSHVGLLRNFILFGYDRASDSVVVGPVKLNKPTEAPRVLEHGGTTTVTKFSRGRLRKRRVRIKARPFMGPALEKERLKLPKLWAGSVRGG
ncbi:MAG: hypothetical protein HUU27_13945 [Phycisphaerae bacterium]|nr:hypothetical protein [Phycisphaerae bacterium]NUQ51007.1 hypothetical protein [Phycisphaerae bacterium]